MSVSPMVEQVNRIVGSMLAWSGEVALPGVGSLFVERRAAKQLSKRSVLPPCRVVEFTSQMRGVSLVDEIARTAQTDAVQARDIYDRWLGHVLEGDVLTIEGVGMLRFKNFTLDSVFDRLLNPQGHEPVRLRSARHFDWVMWFGVTIIVLVVGGGAFLWMNDGNLLSGMLPDNVGTEQVVVADADEVAEVQPETIPEQTLEERITGADLSQPGAQAAAVEPAAAAKSLEVARQSASQTAAQPALPAKAVTQPANVAGAPDAPAGFTTGRRYVVLGVFSTAENAARAIREAVTKDASLRCSVFRFGSKLMVSPFDAADAEPCVQFIRDKTDAFPGMWTYTAK